MRLLDKSVRPVWWRVHRSGSWTRCLCVFVGAVVYSMHYIWRCRRCSSSSRTLTSPSWRRGLFPCSRLFGCSYVSPSCRYTWWLSRLCSCFTCHRCSSEYERRCIHAATSSCSSLCRMGPRPVHRPLCWERLRGILLRPGRGNAPFGDECGIFLGDPNVFSCGGSFACAFTECDPNVSVRRIEASFRKRGNSLSGNP